jgi:hypothetical protein
MHLKNKESAEMHPKKESEKMHLKKESEEMPNGGVCWRNYARFHSNFVIVTNFNELNLNLNSK